MIHSVITLERHMMDIVPLYPIFSSFSLISPCTSLNIYIYISLYLFVPTISLSLSHSLFSSPTDLQQPNVSHLMNRSTLSTADRPARLE